MRRRWWDGEEGGVGADRLQSGTLGCGGGIYESESSGGVMDPPAGGGPWPLNGRGIVDSEVMERAALAQLIF